MYKVFKFTLLQSMKSTGIKVITGIMCLVILLSMPVLHVLNQRDDDGGGATVDKVLVWDESGLNLGDFSGMKANSEYKKVEFGTASSEKDVVDNTLLLHITKEETGYTIRYVAAADGDLSEMTVMELSEDFDQQFNELRQRSQGLTEAQIKDINQDITTDVVWLDKEGKAPSDTEDDMSMEQYYLFLASFVLFVMLISFSAEAVSSSIVTEKSNKLVENLMISVDTKSLIWGKVLGALGVVMAQLGLMIVCGIASGIITMLAFGMDQIVLPEQLATVVSATNMPGLSLFNIIVAVVSFLSGVLFFAIMAALFGAAISKTEDMGEGMKIFNVILVLSAYAGLGIKISSLASGGGGLIERILCFVPFCTPFLAPANLLTGVIPLYLVLAILAVQIISIVLLSMLVTRVYRSMIMYKGDVMKLRQIFRLARRKEADPS